jgi:tripeptidyl-peptidase-1
LAGPYVTAVGGTTGYAPDSAATFSGGGFSNYFERPPFQKKAVPDYLEQLDYREINFYKCVYFCDLTSLMLQ